MKKSYLILAAVAGLFASCSQNEDLVKVADEPVMIGFDAFAENLTRTAITEGKNLTKTNGGFGVWGYKDPTAAKVTVASGAIDVTTGGTSTMQNVFNNVQVWYEDASTKTQGYTYEVPKYWDKNQFYAFFAYAPYSAADASIENTTGKITLSNIPAKQDLSVSGTTAVNSVNYTTYTQTGTTVTDYLIASCVDNQAIDATNQSAKSYDGKNLTVGFTFAHILSQLKVNVKMHQTGADTYKGIKSLKVTSLNIENLPNNTETASFKQNAVNDVAGTYTPANYTTSLEIIGGTNPTSSADLYLLAEGAAASGTTPIAAPSHLTQAFLYYLAPNAPATSSKYLLNINYTIEYVDGVVENVTREDIDLSAATANMTQFQQGYIYTLNIDVDLNQIYFTVDAITDWTNATATDVVVQ